MEKTSWNSRRIFAAVSIATPKSAVWLALSDYDNLGKFIPSLVENRCLERGGRTAVLYQVGPRRCAASSNRGRGLQHVVASGAANTTWPHGHAACRLHRSGRALTPRPSSAAVPNLALAAAHGNPDCCPQRFYGRRAQLLLRRPRARRTDSHPSLPPSMPPSLRASRHQVGAQDVAMGVKFSAAVTLRCCEHQNGGLPEALMTPAPAAQLGSAASGSSSSSPGGSVDLAPPSASELASVEALFPYPLTSAPGVSSSDITFELVEGDFQVWTERLQGRAACV